MAASTRLGGPGVTQGANIANLASRGQNIFPQAFPTASVSVGQDDWATQVIDNVVGSPQEWVESREDILKKTIVEKKRLFHNNRFLELKNLPDGVTEQDIRTAFPDIELTAIILEKSDGRYRPGAKLSLAVPELLDDWPKARENVFVKNKEVSVCVGSSDQWVCIARLPLDLSDQEFTTLVSGYGKVRSCFLMCSEKSGESKGYGLVKYCSNEAAAQARHLLDGRDIRGFSIQADWLNSTHISFKQLHSKCLYVDNLPLNYRDMTTYRKIFSVIKNPPYCQIAMRNGVIQDWGLVEFFDSEEAEKTQEELNGYNLKGHNIRVHYCIPGVNAINIYMKVVNTPSDTKKKALLDDAPSSSVYTQLQKLASQNPVFAQNLQNIIQTQIQTIQTGIPPEKRQSSPSPTPPTEILPPSLGSQQQINSNAQAALMILLTAQRQAQTGENSLLHNPEVVNVLQSLVCQANDPMKTDMDPYAEIMSIPGITVALGQPPTQQVPVQLSYPAPTSAAGWAHQPQLISSTKDRQVIVTSPNSGSTSPSNPQGKSPPPIIANNLNLLSNAQSLNQLLGVISKPIQSPPPPPPTSQPKTSSAPPSITSAPQIQRQTPSPVNKIPNQQRPALLGDCPRPQIPSSQPPPNMQQQLAQHANMQHLLQVGQQQQQQLLHAQMTAVGQMQAASQLQMSQQLAGYYPQYQQLQQGPFLIPSIPGLPMTGPPHAGFFIQPPQQFGANANLMGALGINNQGLLAGQTIPMSLPSMNSNSYQIMPPMTSPVRSPIPRISSPASSISSSASYTPSPTSLKRKASIPASPESSPQGPYIGQHSQGLGGHYADSYWQQKRLKQNY